MKLTRNLTAIIIVFILAFAGYASIEFYVSNRPEITPDLVIEEKLKDIFENDSVIEKPIIVNYLYKDSKFETTSDSTYWFVLSEITTKNGGTLNKQTWSRCVKMPYSFFNFVYFCNIFEKEHPDVNVTHIWVSDFQEVSEASYISYDKYVKIY